VDVYQVEDEYNVEDKVRVICTLSQKKAKFQLFNFIWFCFFCHSFVTLLRQQYKNTENIFLLGEIANFTTLFSQDG